MGPPFFLLGSFSALNKLALSRSLLRPLLFFVNVSPHIQKNGQCVPLYIRVEEFPSEALAFRRSGAPRVSYWNSIEKALRSSFYRLTMKTKSFDRLQKPVLFNFNFYVGFLLS